MYDNLIQPETSDAVRKPLLEASTLPAHCYTSEEFHQREIEQIFLANWQLAGRMEQVSEPGQYFCYEGIGGSVIIMRSKGDEVNAFANSCRHRGSRLLSGSGKCQRILCPYHSWVYQLDGKLMQTPGMDEILNFDKEEFPLIEVALATWGGFIFINYQAPRSSLMDYLGNIPAKFNAHQSVKMRHVHSIEFDIKSNWKLLAENALEAYHTGSVHRKTLGQQVSSPIETTTNWTGLLVKDENSVGTMPNDNKPFPHIKGLSEEASSGTYFTMLFPATQLVFAQDCMWWLALRPLAVDRTRLTLSACFPESTIDLPDFDRKVKPYFKRWELATREDNSICEFQQQGQKFDRPAGRFSAAEFAVHEMSNWILDQLLDD